MGFRAPWGTGGWWLPLSPLLNYRRSKPGPSTFLACLERETSILHQLVTQEDPTQTVVSKYDSNKNVDSQVPPPQPVKSELRVFKVIWCTTRAVKLSSCGQGVLVSSWMTAVEVTP